MGQFFHAMIPEFPEFLEFPEFPVLGSGNSYQNSWNSWNSWYWKLPSTGNCGVKEPFHSQFPAPGILGILGILGLWHGKTTPFPVFRAGNSRNPGNWEWGASCFQEILESQKNPGKPKKISEKSQENPRNSSLSLSQTFSRIPFPNSGGNLEKNLWKIPV